MSNPKAFVKDAKKIGVTYELLQEAIKCVGAQATSRMFTGKSRRGGGSCQSATNIENWLATFQYNIDHPDEEDHDPYQARSIIPCDSWFEFTKLVHIPISDDVQNSWLTMSNISLGNEAAKWGITFGIRNAKAVKTLLERMQQMVSRRKVFWESNQETSTEETDTPDFRLMNTVKLHELCKARGITSVHLKKDEMIDLLNKYVPPDVITLDYEKMTLLQLKTKAKEKGLVEYNNLDKTQLITSLSTVDQEEQKIAEQGDNIMIHGITIIARKEDKYIDVTRFLQASKSGKEYSNWYQCKRSKSFLDKLSIALNIPRTELIFVHQGGTNQGTWVHPRVAINIAQWISPEFDVAVSGWIHQLLSEGSVRLQRPVKCLTDLTEIDIEAEQMEIATEADIVKYSSDCVLYMSYIGNGLVKVGYSDGKFLARNLKHQSCESEYAQWRVIKVFLISGKPVETRIHKQMVIYKANFNKQKEIYKPPGTLVDFARIIGTLLRDTDLKIRVSQLEKENMLLKLRIAELTSSA